MTASVTLWTAALCKQNPGYGGWAFVSRQDGQSGALALKGAAGGERRTSLARMSLSAVIEALSSLSDLPADTAVTLQVADPALPGELTAAEGDYATAEPEAWAAARALVAGRPSLTLTLVPALAPAAGFLNAWAEFGLDTSKSRGSFKAAIPKPNLLKFPG